MTTRYVPLDASGNRAEKRDDAIRIAQVGLAGGIGYSHINEVEKNPAFRLIGGYDLYPADERVAAAIERLKKNGSKIYRTFEELLADRDVEAVDICTPHHFHRPMTVAAFKAGKHVLVEKPMATHPDDCEQMIAAQRAAGRVGAVQMQQVGRRSLIQLREAIQRGAVGRIREVFLCSLWWRSEEYFDRIAWAGRMKIDGAWCVDGALYNQCVHYINQMLTLVSPGPLPSVAQVKDLACSMYKFHENPKIETGDTAFITGVVDIADAPRLTAVGTTCSTEERHSIEVIGEKGRAMWNGAGYVFPEGQPVIEFHDDRKPLDGNTPTFNSFAEAIRSGDPGACMTSFAEIQKVTKFINDCYEACRWQIKKAPWSATSTLFSEVIQKVREQRCLPAKLKHAPSWA